MTDATGSLTLFTSKTATFAQSVLPVGARDWIGYVVIFNALNEFEIRNQSDVLPLPLKFISFVAKKSGSGNTLTWNTATEINTAKFSVQRSLNGAEFTTIATIEAKGSGNNAFTYTDGKADAVTYYRILGIDKDGKTTLSENTVCGTTSETKLSVFPNPAASVLNVVLPAGNSAKNLVIYNIEGKLVKSVPATEALVQKLDVAALKTGTYQLVVETVAENKIVASFFKK